MFPCIIRGFLIYKRKREQDFRKIVAALICSIDFIGSVTGDKFVDRFVDSGVNKVRLQTFALKTHIRLLYELLFIKELKPSLNVQSDSITTKVFRIIHIPIRTLKSMIIISTF